jgi:GntR family transcriptional repressor for pyruvate dehydrogenase complex
MIKRVELHEAIVNEIKKYIRDNNLKPGDKLGTQNQLTSTFGVSITALREALRTLRALGVIEVKNGKGIYVLKQIGFKFESDIEFENIRQKVLYVMEFRESIEASAVKLASKRATEEDIKEMEKNLEIMLEKESKGLLCTEADKAFHDAIFKASHNPILIRAVEYGGLKMLWENPLGAGKAITEETGLHKEMFEHIKNKEPEKAVKVFYKLMDNIKIICKII